MKGIRGLQLNLSTPADFDFSQPLYEKSGQFKLSALNYKGRRNLEVCGTEVKRSILAPIKAMESSKTTSPINGNAGSFRQSGCNTGDDVLTKECKSMPQMSTIGNSTNIVWHKCIVEKSDRQELLGQKGCVIWITGLSGSGKSTLACALIRGLHARGKLTYILDGDNVRHGLNSDLGFKAEDRAENIRRIGEVAKLFSDAGVICIASLISPYRKDRDACRSLLPEGDFIEEIVSSIWLAARIKEEIEERRVLGGFTEDKLREELGLVFVCTIQESCFKTSDRRSESLCRQLCWWYSWMFLCKSARRGIQRDYTSLPELEKSKVLQALMIHMSHH